MNRSSPSSWLRPLTWVLAGLTLLLAAMLIWQCAAIYAAGVAPENLSPTGVRLSDMYSRAIVAERLSSIKIPAILWGVLTLALIAARLALPREKAAKPSITPEARLKLVLTRIEKTDVMHKEEHRRRNAAIICLTVCLASAAVAAVYLVNPNHFTSWDLELVMGAMLLHVLPPMAVMFAALMAYAAWRRGSVLRELEAAKSAPRVAASQSVPKEEQRQKPLNTARIVLYAAAIALVIAGILNGGMYDVLVKAINICTECIGLG